MAGSLSRILAGVILATSAAVANQFRVPSETGWVGLYTDRLIEWLENENRLGELCGASGSSEQAKCREEKLRPQRFVIPLYDAANSRSAPVGSVLLLATPGKGLRFFYQSPAGGTPREFSPDLNMQDWGYGPYFHQTYLARRGTWFLLPEDPLPRPLWFDSRSLGKDPDVILVNDEHIFSSPRGNLVILGVERDVIRARDEQSADMWCDHNPPPLQPWTELRIAKRDVYGRTGHLLLAPAYMKGC